MRKCINKTLNNEFKKPYLTKFYTKDDMVSPTYIPRKIRVRNIHNNKSPRNTNLQKSENVKILSTKRKNSTHSILNSEEVDKKKDKNIQKSKYLNKDFNSEIFSNILSKKINKKNIENIILYQRNIFKNRNYDYSENKENIMQNCNDKYDIKNKLNKNNNKLKNFEINNSNIDIKIHNNNNIISSIQQNNYIKKIISFENRNTNFYNNTSNIKNTKELNSNMIHKNKKKISNNNINNSNCLSNRVIYNYLNNNYINSSNNINSNYDNSFLGNISANQRRKKSFYNCSTNTPDNPKFFINNKINKDESYLGSDLTFRKVKPKIFYKSPYNKYKCSQKNLQENQLTDEYSNSKKNNNIKQNCLMKYPSSRDSTCSQFNIKNSTNLKNKNSYFSLNYTNTDINDNSSIKTNEKKLSKKMKNSKNDNIYVKINKEKLLKKSVIIKEYLNKERENYYNDYNDEMTKTDFKMSNKFLSVNLRKKYSDNVIKNKPITYRTLTNFYKKGKTESFNSKDIIIRVNNNRNRELSYQKGKKLNQNNSLSNNKVIYNVKSIKLPNEEQIRNKTPKRNDKKQNRLINNISKGIPNSEVDNKIKKNTKNEKSDKNGKSDSENKNNQNNTKGSSSTSNHLYNTYITKNSTNSSFLLNDEIKNLDINAYTEKLYFTENSTKVNENDQKIINLDIFYTLESKLNILLLKLNNYEICYNETQDWLSYFFGNYFYEKEIEMFDLEQNKKQMIYYINFELICYFMCYDISFNKNYNQVSILLKTIFNLLHKNYLCLISYTIKKITEKNESKDINIINNNNYVEQMIIIKKLQEVIKSELKMNLEQDINEDVVLEIVKDNFKQISNYYNMIIENIYSTTLEISDKVNNISFENNILQKKIIYYKFPECLKINILKINDKKKSYIITDFFKNALNSIELYNIKEFKYFYNLYLNKSTDNLFIQQHFQNKKLYSLVPSSPYSQVNSDKKILSPINSEKYTYSLILDLDETLIHLEREYYTFNNIHNIKNKKLTLRPGLINFLEKMKKIYEIILFTFSPKDYADAIVDVIEKDEKYFEHKLYVQHASYNNGKFVKDINDLGRDIKSTIIIEDNINNVYKSNLDNTICIKPFYGECNNEKNTLQLLGNILNKVRYDAEITGDIRKSIMKEKYNIITEISSNLEE